MNRAKMETHNAKVRVRFAPSPTGKLHLGNARTAIFNMLFSLHYSGKFVLRIEDTDLERSARVYEKRLIETLHWLGIDWDEGPDVGGDYGPYRQSERLEIYRPYIERLVKEGKAYYCYCTQRELEEERRELLLRGLPPRYSGRCRYLTERERRRFEAEGRRPTIRFLVPDETIKFFDLIKGEMRFEGAAIGDFIIVRSSGVPAYNLAVVIDDALMEITHVIRGEDHLSNTPCQLFLYKALGLKPPKFAHHPLLLGPDRTKLSKRHGDVSVEEYREKGFLPEALLNYLVITGTVLEREREIFSKEEMIKLFKLEKLSKSNAIFDLSKLKWMNRHYLRSLPLEDILDSLRPFLKEEEFKKLKENPKILGAILENVETLLDIPGFLDIFLKKGLSYTEEARDIIRQKGAKEVIDLFYQYIVANKHKDLMGILDEIILETGFKKRKVMMPIRAAITGSTVGPELKKIFELLPREWIVERLIKAKGI